MLKKTALLIISFVLVVGAFLLYQHLTGASFLETRKTVPAPVSPTDQERPPTFESRRPNGDLEYLLTTRKAVPVKDAHGRPVAGEYALTEPAASYYTQDGNIVYIRADRGTLKVDQEGSSTGRSHFAPIGGHLSGHVVLVYGPRDSFSTNVSELQPGQLQVRFEKDLDLNYAEQIITSPGLVHVRSEKIVFDGENLTIAFNKQMKQIELLRIDPPAQGGKNGFMLIRDVASQGFGTNLAAPAAGKNGGQSGSTPTTVAATATPPASAGHPAPASSEAAPAENAAARRPTYKLSFGKNVSAQLGGAELTSEQLFVMFMSPVEATEKSRHADASRPGEGLTPPAAPAARRPAAPTGTPANSAANAPAAAAPAPSEPLDPNAPPRATDLVVRWEGPMEMRPAATTDLHLTDKRDAVLEALGTRQRPVIVHDAASTLRAGRLWYHRAEDRLELQPAAVGEVAVSDKDAANPSLGVRTLTCQGVTVLRTANLVKLAGPGRFEVPQGLLGRKTGTGRPLVGSWQKELTVELALAPVQQANAKGKAADQRERRVPRRVRFTGGVDITDVGFHIDSQTLDVLVASGTAPKAKGAGSGPTQRLEHLLATGDVHVKVGRNGAGVADAARPDGINAQRLEISTEHPSPAALPVPSRLLATGNVEAWSYQPHRENGKETGTLDRDAIYTPTFDVALEPKQMAATASRQNADLNGGLATADVKSLVARDGVRVELAGNFGKDTVTASGHTLTVQMNGGRGNAVATLDGQQLPDGKTEFAQLSQGAAQHIGGEHIVLNEKQRSIDIPGHGLFAFVRPAEKAGDQPTPVQVTWDRNMSFNEKEKMARFFGNVDAHIVDRTDEESKLTCTKELDVQLGETAADKTTGGRTAAGDKTATAGKSSGLRSLRAQGNVVAEGSKLDAQGKILAGLLLKTDLLTYDGSTRTLSAPGAGQMAIVDYSPDKPGTPANLNSPASANDAKGETRFTWSGNLSYDQASGLIAFDKNVEMWHHPLKPFKLGNASSAGKQGNPNPPIILTTDLLTAKLIQARHTPAAPTSKGAMNANPLALGANGDQKIERVLAQGNARLQMNEDRLTAHSLAFDALKNVATAEADADVPAEIYRPGQAIVQCQKVVWDLSKNDNNVTITGLIGSLQQ